MASDDAAAGVSPAPAGGGADKENVFAGGGGAEEEVKEEARGDVDSGTEDALEFDAADILVQDFAGTGRRRPKTQRSAAARREAVVGIHRACGAPATRRVRGPRAARGRRGRVRGGRRRAGATREAPAQVELHEEEDGSIREGARLASPARALHLEAKAGRRGSRGNASWKKRRRTPVFKKMSRPWEWWEKTGLLLGCWFAAAAAAGPEYVDASLAALECAWWLARVLVHRALGTALLFAVVVLHLVSHYRVLLVRSYVLIWWRLECDADDLELDCTWTQTLETALRRSRRFWRAGHYYSALRSLERVYESVRSTWPQAPYVRLDKSDSTSLQRECSARARSGKSIHAARPSREMIARPKISRNEWKTAEI